MLIAAWDFAQNITPPIAKTRIGRIHSPNASEIEIAPTKDSGELFPPYPKSKIVISAGIAEFQEPWMASVKHILMAWLPAIPDGMMVLLKHL